MVTSNGWILDVELRTLGTTVTSDEAMGVVTFGVDDAFVFDPNGGNLTFDGVTPVPYDAADVDADTVTILAGLPVAVSANDPVLVWDDTLAAPATSPEALVEMASAGIGADPVWMLLAPTDADTLPLGTRGGRGETVLVSRHEDTGLWMVDKILSTRGARLATQAGLDATTTIAEAAQASANGKNTVTYATAAPTSASPGIPGDLTFVWDATTHIVSAVYVCTAGTGTTSGNTWTPSTTAGDLIASGIDAGNITVGTLNGIIVEACEFISTPAGTGGAGDNRIDINATLTDAISFYNGGTLAGQIMGMASPSAPGVSIFGGSAGTTYAHVGPNEIDLAATSGGVITLNGNVAISSTAPVGGASTAVTLDNSRITLTGYVATSGILHNGDTQMNGALTLHGSAAKFNQDTGTANNFVSQAILATVSTQPAMGVSGTGIVCNVGSARRFKKDISYDLPTGRPSLIDSLQPVVYRDNTDSDPALNHDGTEKVHYGFIAEDVHDLGYHELVFYADPDEAGNVQTQSLHYDRFLAALLPELKAMKAELAELRGRVQLA